MKLPALLTGGAAVILGLVILLAEGFWNSDPAVYRELCCELNELRNKRENWQQMDVLLYLNG